MAFMAFWPFWLFLQKLIGFNEINSSNFQQPLTASAGIFLAFLEFSGPF
jgi:hypothetical protein